MTGHGLVLGKASPQLPPPRPCAPALADERAQAEAASASAIAAIGGAAGAQLHSELARAKQESQAFNERLRQLGFCVP